MSYSEAYPIAWIMEADVLSIRRIPSVRGPRSVNAGWCSINALSSWFAVGSDGYAIEALSHAALRVILHEHGQLHSLGHGFLEGFVRPLELRGQSRLGFSEIRAALLSQTLRLRALGKRLRYAA